jgi:uncharacterized membrane protein
MVLHTQTVFLTVSGNNVAEYGIYIVNNVTQGSRYWMKRQGENDEFRLFDFEELLEATSNFSEGNKLGEGGFGTVYKVNY